MTTGIHNPEQLPISGFWGPVTSTIDWCEWNYAKTFYIAEFFNTISNAAILLIALLHLYHARKHQLGQRFEVVSVFFSIVGLGSAFFHGSLKYEAQMLDELPLMYMVTSGLYVVVENKPRRQFRWLAPVLVITAIIHSLVYIFVLPDMWEFFGVPFTLLMWLGLANQLRYVNKDPAMNRILLFTIATWVIATIAWLADQWYCPEMEHWQLHAVWHILTAFSGGANVTLIEFIRWRFVLSCHDTKIRWIMGLMPICEVNPGDVSRMKLKLKAPELAKDTIKDKSL